MKAESNKVLGLLKIGIKNLWISHNKGPVKEIKPMCVLDFYVHESCQRMGVGRQLFEYMLYDQNLQAHQLGYDSPSDKLLAFCAKHYNLTSYEEQSNKFVVYAEYFTHQGLSRQANTYQAQRPSLKQPQTQANDYDRMVQWSSSQYDDRGDENSYNRGQAYTQYSNARRQQQPFQDYSNSEPQTKKYTNVWKQANY